MGKSFKKNVGKIAGFALGDITGSLIGSAYDRKKKKKEQKKKNAQEAANQEAAEPIESSDEYVYATEQRRKAANNLSYSGGSALKETFGG